MGDTHRMQEEEMEALKAIFMEDYEQVEIQVNSAWKVPVKEYGFKLRLSANSEELKGSVAVILHVRRCKDRFPTRYPRHVPELRLEKVKGLSEEQLKTLTKFIHTRANALKGEVMIFELASLIQEQLSINNSVIREGRQASFYEQMVHRREQIELEEQERVRKALNRAQMDAEVADREKHLALAQDVEEEIQRKQSRLRQERQRRKEENMKVASPDLLQNVQSAGAVRQTFMLKDTQRLMVYKKGILSTMYLVKPTSLNIPQPNTEPDVMLITREIRITNPYYTTQKGRSEIGDLVYAAQELSGMHHAHIQNVFDAQFIRECDRSEVAGTDGSVRVEILTECGTGGSLRSLLNRSGTMAANVVRGCMMALASALCFIHQLDISHNDIHRKNPFREDIPDITPGQEGWRPPEDDSSRITGQKYDIWCLGRTFCEMLYGNSLCEDFENFEQFARSAKFIPPLILSICSSLLQTDPSTRPDASTVLKHPFFRDDDTLGISLTTKANVSMTSGNSGSGNNQLVIKGKAEKAVTRDDDDVGELGERLPIKPLFDIPSIRSRYRADFEEFGFLGKGGFGAVVKVRNKIDGRFYAVKRIILERNSSRRILREVQTISRLQHTFVVRYYQAWFEEVDGSPTWMDYDLSDDGETDNDDDDDDCTDTGDEDDENGSSKGDESDWLASRENSYAVMLSKRSGALGSPEEEGKHQLCLYIQMEYCEKKTLSDVIQQGLDQDEEWRLFRQILEGLSHVHSQGMIHRDLKPSNIFLDGNGNVKIGDFGLAVEFQQDGFFPKRLGHDGFFDESNTQGDVGTPIYIAPEVVAKMGKYTAKVDMYSLGICFFEMCYPMPTGMQRALCLRDIRLPAVTFPNDYDYKHKSDQAAIIRLLLSHTPKERPSCSDLMTSKLLPPLMEEEYFAEALRIIVSRTNTLHYSRLMQSIFAQSASKTKQLSFDYGGAAAGAGGGIVGVGLEGLDMMGIAGFVKHLIVKAFQRHGAMEIVPPLLLPKTDLYSGSNKRPAEYVDISGNIVQLPYDFTIPFARFVSRISPHITRLKRYAFGRVYRHNLAGGQPRHVYECDFDIVHRVPGNMVPDAEVIKGVIEVVESFPELRFDSLEIRVNHTTLLSSVLNRCGFPSSPDLRRKAFSILEQIDRPLSWNQVVSELMASLGVSAPHIQLLASFRDMIGEVGVVKERFIAQLKEHGNANVKDAVGQLVLLQSHLVNLGLSTKVVLTPLLAYNTHYFIGGIVFQVAGISKRKQDLLAAGGRYDALLQELRNPFTPPHHNLYAVGANIAVQKIIHASVAAQSSALRSMMVFRPETEPSELQHNRKIEVLVCSFGKGLQALHDRMALASECWAAGLSADFQYHDPASLPQVVQSAGSKGYSFCVMIKQRGKDGSLIKVKNLHSKMETEVSRNEIIPFLKEELAEPQTIGPTVEHANDINFESSKSSSSGGPSIYDGAVNIIPVALSKAKSLKHKQKVVIIEKASHGVEAQLKNMSKANILAIDLDVRTLNRITSIPSHKFTDDDAFTRMIYDVTAGGGGGSSVSTTAGGSSSGAVAHSREYLNQIRKSLVKCMDEKHKFVWLFSIVDSQAVLCQLHV